MAKKKKTAARISSAKKDSAKKHSARKASAKKAPAKKPASRKSAANASTARKATDKKPAAKKPPAKKALGTPSGKKVAAEGKKPPAGKKPASKLAKAGSKGPEWAREGAPAPEFTATAHDGSKLALSSLRGKTVVLYFYPKDDTPGCTIEACGFRDTHANLEKHGAVVLGVSPDSAASHVKFRAKYKLPFTLLADEDHRIAEAFGAWREKSLYGRAYMGVARSTFVIGPDGKVARAFTAVKPEGHDKEVLGVVAAMR